MFRQDMNGKLTFQQSVATYRPWKVVLDLFLHAFWNRHIVLAQTIMAALTVKCYQLGIFLPRICTRQHGQMGCLDSHLAKQSSWKACLHGLETTNSSPRWKLDRHMGQTSWWIRAGKCCSCSSIKITWSKVPPSLIFLLVSVSDCNIPDCLRRPPHPSSVDVNQCSGGLEKHWHITKGHTTQQA